MRRAGEAPIEIGPIDIARYRTGNTGVPYVTSLASGLPGPHVMVTALIHGNEISGAHALRFLLERGIRPHRGRLTLAFANVAAYARFDAKAPYASRFVDEDLNRVWDTATLEGPRASVELTRARALRPIVDGVDRLLDLHSTSLAMAPMLLCGMPPKGLALARAVGFPRHVVIDAGHAEGRRLRDYDGFGEAGNGRAALLLESGPHFAAASVRVAIEGTLRFLLACGTIAAATAAPHLGPPPAGQTVIRVTERVVPSHAGFAFTRPLAGFEVIAGAGTEIARDGETVIRTPYDDCVVVMPSATPRPGLTAVRLGRIEEAGATARPPTKRPSSAGSAS